MNSTQRTASSLVSILGVLASVGCAAKGASNPGEGSDAMATTQLEGGSGNGQDGPGGQGSDAGSDGSQSQTGSDSGSTTGDAGGDAGSGVGDAGCTGLPLCDNFEEDTAGTAPTGWSLVLGCNASQASDTAADGGLSIGVVTSEHHNGKNSVQVAGGDSCGYYLVNTSAFSTLGSQVYARFWVMFSGAPTTGHNGFLSMYSGPAESTAVLDYNNTGQLRLGFQGGVVVWNSTIAGADSTLPDIDSTGEAQSVVTPTMQWSCIEFHIDQTNANIEFRYEAPGTSTETSVAGLSYDGTSTAGVSDTWKSSGPTPPLQLRTFGLGWLGLNNQYAVWFDDVALSGTTWIGCD